jgi:hypothetical protein
MITVINDFVFFYHDNIGISDMIDTANKSWLIHAYRDYTIQHYPIYWGLSQFTMINPINH